MIEFQHRIEIDRSPAEVFAVLADVERSPEWQASVLDVARPGTGALRSGSEFEQTWKAMGRRRRVATRVVAHRPNHLIAFAGDAGFLDYYCGFELSESRSGGTVLVNRSEFRLHGLWKLLRPLLGGEMRREVGAELAELKRVLERDTAPTPRIANQAPQ